MNTRVQKWGNSLALRIPSALAQELGLYPNAPVKITLNGTRLIIEPAPQVDLDTMLAEITPENVHGEVDFGASVGNEVW